MARRNTWLWPGVGTAAIAILLTAARKLLTSSGWVESGLTGLVTAMVFFFVCHLYAGFEASWRRSDQQAD